LVRNILLTRDRNIIRKLKEMVLTKQLNKVLEEEIREDHRGLTD
jgi:membrane peptidoglycan carboxypeptidase